MNNTRTAILGYNALFREGLRRILADTSFEVILSSDKSECLLNLDCIRGSENLIVIIDQSYIGYGEDEISAVRGKFPSAKLVHLARKFDLNEMISAFRSGAQGYIIKDIRCESLIGSLHLIALGEKVLPGELIEQLDSAPAANGMTTPSCNDLHELLSAREIEILHHLAAGLPNKAIANRLELSDGAVKVHVKGILRKLNVSNRTQAAVIALNSGLGTAPQRRDTDQDIAASWESPVQLARVG